MEHAAYPLVTVVTAFLNEARFLAQAVESVLQQEYAHWELLLVDDGSTDQSTAIAKEYAAQFPSKIFYCEHSGHANRGLSASRNFGIRQGRGSLIAILDADDIWLPAKLATQVALFQRHPEIGMVAEASLYWYSWDGSAQADVLIPVGAPADRVYPPAELLLRLYPLGTTAAPCPSGLMIHRRAYLAVGGFEESFNKEFQLYEDQAFLTKVYLTEQVYISAACHNYYRQRVGSIVQAVNQQGLYHRVRRHFLEWFSTYLLHGHFSNRAVQQALAAALFPYHHPLLHGLRGLAVRLKNRIRL
ncbi:glycosyltransferase family 2 protein [Hymenobacter radiodurans]|uniref:glycosyltransferase family 2 protein n=1 Tax=Hymenobacter radiodurans TaxID=2496028 RepID=UPI001058A6BE|nr:glycosyltransferase family A protein [Hymenobacter radiodurans]